MTQHIPICISPKPLYPIGSITPALTFPRVYIVCTDSSLVMLNRYRSRTQGKRLRVHTIHARFQSCGFTVKQLLVSKISIFEHRPT